MNTFKVTYTDGISYITSANGTAEQFKAYLMQDGGRIVTENPATGKETVHWIAKVEEVISMIHPNEQRARALIAARTTYDLIADFEESERQPMSDTLPLVRGWLMDELEKRNKVAFDCWLESNEASPRKFFVL